MGVDDKRSNMQALQVQWLQWLEKSLQSLQAVHTTSVPSREGSAQADISDHKKTKTAAPNREETSKEETNQEETNAAMPWSLDSDKLLDIQRNYLQELETLRTTATGESEYKLTDRRFSSEVWSENPLAQFFAAVYLLNAKTLKQLTDAVGVEKKTKERLSFAVTQWVDAMSPANFFAFNPEAQKRLLETEGKSLAQGIQNLLYDLRIGRISQTDETEFEVGKNIAASEGMVVYENEIFQLIQYKPLTPKVYERPLLFVPPCINKFYILDLQPENSLIRYTVEQGHRVFIVSWRNADKSIEHASWDDYIEKGVLEAIVRVKTICRAPDVNVLGFCVGGTLLANALAVLADRKEKWVNSATFLTTFVDFSDTGVLGVLIDEGMVCYREQQFRNGGLLLGKELATTFNFLKPNDLVWNYVQDNYMLGKQPRPFDLLYWNSDSTNLPGSMYAWYLRNTYLENNLVRSGACTVAGSKIDMRKVTIPLYFYASREDHIVPPQSAYASAKHFGGKSKRFVLGASGHIAGVINSAKNNKRCYWIGPKDRDLAKKSYQEWQTIANEQTGSWWPDWANWLSRRSGKKISAPKSYGNAKNKPIEAAPGRYVKAKAVTV